jgi:hypothetical protein
VTEFLLTQCASEKYKAQKFIPDKNDVAEFIFTLSAYVTITLYGSIKILHTNMPHITPNIKVNANISGVVLVKEWRQSSRISPQNILEPSS